MLKDRKGKVKRAWKTPTEIRREISARNGKQQVEVEDRTVTELGRRSKGRKVSIKKAAIYSENGNMRVGKYEQLGRICINSVCFQILNSPHQVRG